MKKLVIKLLLSVIPVALCACNGSSNPNSNETVQSNSEAINTSDDQAGKAQSAENDSYSSPENAIYTFIEAVKGGDLNEITSSFAIENYIDGYNPDDDLATNIPPSTLEQRMVEVYGQISAFYLGFSIMMDEPPNLDDFSKTDIESLINQQQYESLQVVRIDLPETDETSHMDRISKDVVEVRLYGAYGWDYRTALLSLNGETYYCGFRFAIYDGKYEIISFSCPIVSLDYRFTTIPCTEEEYVHLTE